MRDGCRTLGDVSDPCFKGFAHPSPQPSLKVVEDEDHAAGLAGILVVLVATTNNMMFTF